MKFSSFAGYLGRLEGVTARLEITAVLAELFKELSPEETPAACYLLQGELRPAYESIEFQVAVKTVVKALARLLPHAAASSQGLFGEGDFSAQERDVQSAYKKTGDLGLVTSALPFPFPKTSSLSILEVYAELTAIAEDNGEQSQLRKLDRFVELLRKLDVLSAKFVLRIILGKLRLGFSDMTMIDALSWVMTGTKNEHAMLELAYQKKADIGKLAQEYLAHRDPQKRQHFLTDYRVEVGVPVMPALCQRLNSAAEMIEKMGDVIAEPKYDGLRVQIHLYKPSQKVLHTHFTNDKDGRVIRTFTRSMEENSHMFPELQHIFSTLKCKECILDAEAIGYDPTTGDFLPFQITVQRKRKHDVSAKASEIPIKFFVFDVLYVDGKELIDQPLSERKKRLQQLFVDDDVLTHAPELRTRDAAELHDFHERTLAEGLEGVVVKQLTSPYQSGRKGWSWVKMKEAEGKSGKLSDTLDVVVMGYYLGRGKRNEFGIGAFLVGVVDEEGERVLTIAKIGTGLTDETLREMKRRCEAVKVAEQPSTYIVHKMLLPDVWCQPQIVVEVAADELTNSPVHSAEVALRFPRLARFRDDKKWQNATTLSEVKTLQRKVS